LILNGASTANNGINVGNQYGGAVEIIDCDISAFQLYGIIILPVASSISITISNTIVAGVTNSFMNGAAIYLASAGTAINAALNQVTLVDNDNGLILSSPSGGPIIATVSNSQINNNNVNGVQLQGNSPPRRR
jgi:hypothetical protein